MESIGKRDFVLCVIVMILGISFIICLNVLFFKKRDLNLFLDIIL